MTIEIVLNSVNNGIYIKKSNPNKNLLYNTDNNNYFKNNDLKNLFPITKEKLKNYILIKDFFEIL